MNEPAAQGTIQRALRGLHLVETWALTGLVLVLVALAGAQILLRNAFGGGISWADPFLRTLVVWTAMLGALAAVREDKHIAVDVLQRYLSARAQRVARVLTLGFSALICAAMAWYSLGLVGIDFAESSSAAAGGAVRAIPGWVLESILPFGFAMMALRFVLRAMATPTHTTALMPDLLHDPMLRHPTQTNPITTDSVEPDLIKPDLIKPDLVRPDLIRPGPDTAKTSGTPE